LQHRNVEKINKSALNFLCGDVFTISFFILVLQFLQFSKKLRGCTTF